MINGRKWWITGAMNPNAKIFIVMGETDPWRRPEIPNVIAGQILG